MNNFKTFLTEDALSVFPIEESEQNKKHRTSIGATRLILVNAKKVKDAFESSHKEELIHKQQRLTNIEQMIDKNQPIDAYPIVGVYPYKGAPPIEIDDGRHRIAVAAKRNMKITVATNETSLPAIKKFK